MRSPSPRDSRQPEVRSCRGRWGCDSSEYPWECAQRQLQVRRATPTKFSKLRSLTMGFSALSRRLAKMTRSFRNRQDHDGNVARACVGLDEPQEIHPRHLGQMEIEQD